jgi:hypothetical protein
MEIAIAAALRTKRYVDIDPCHAAKLRHAGAGDKKGGTPAAIIVPDLREFST